MANGTGQLEKASRSRVSFVILGISLAGFYYSSQVFLDYETFWWVYVIAIASSVLFVVGLRMAVIDWKGEREWRDTRIDWLKDQGHEPETEDEQEPVDETTETGTTPFADWRDLIE